MLVPYDLITSALSGKQTEFYVLLVLLLKTDGIYSIETSKFRILIKFYSAWYDEKRRTNGFWSLQNTYETHIDCLKAITKQVTFLQKQFE